MPRTPVQIYWPLHATAHPDADAVDEQAVKWLRGFPGLLDQPGAAHLPESGIAACVAHACPHGSPEQILPSAQALLLLTALDDWLESLDSLAQAVAASCALQYAWEAPGLEVPGLPAPYALACTEAIAELRRTTSPVQYRRIVAQLRVYHQAIPWETAVRRGGAVPDLATYAILRPRIFAIHSLFAFHEAAGGTELSEHHHTDPALRALKEALGLLATGFNDLVSAVKESNVPTLANLPAVLAKAHGHGPQKAVEASVDLLNRTMLLFVRLYGDLRARADQELHAYLDAVDAMAGNLLLWHTRSPRYTDVPSFVLLPEPPPGLDPAPPPVPSIAWWWEVR